MPYKLDYMTTNMSKGLRFPIPFPSIEEVELLSELHSLKPSEIVGYSIIYYCAVTEIIDAGLSIKLCKEGDDGSAKAIASLPTPGDASVLSDDRFTDVAPLSKLTWPDRYIRVSSDKVRQLDFVKQRNGEETLSYSALCTQALTYYLDCLLRVLAHKTGFLGVTDGTRLIREIRLPGYPHRNKAHGAKEHKSRSGKPIANLVSEYIDSGDFNLFGSSKSDDRLSLCALIARHWFGHSQWVNEFVLSKNFERLVSAVNYVRTDLAAALREQNEIDLDSGGVDKLDELREAITLMGHLDPSKSTRQTVEGIESLDKALLGLAPSWLMETIEDCDANPSDDNASLLKRVCNRELNKHDWSKLHKIRARGRTSHFFGQMLSYESVDCRLGHCSEVAINTALRRRNQFEPIVASVGRSRLKSLVRLLSRISNNMYQRGLAFGHLNGIDLVDLRGSHGSRRLGDKEQSQDLAESLHFQLNLDWSEKRPWLAGRDQQVRELLIRESLRNLLLGRDLDLAYIAFDESSNGRISQSWNDMGERLSRCSQVESLIEAHYSLRKTERSRYILSGYGVHFSVQDGWIAVAHTHRRLFALGVFSKGTNTGSAWSCLDTINNGAGIRTRLVEPENNRTLF